MSVPESIVKAWGSPERSPRFSAFHATNAKAANIVLLHLKQEPDWLEEGGEAGQVSQTTGRETTMPHARCQCPGKHDSGRNTAQDLKIYLDCHPAKIGVYCWHPSCQHSWPLAVEIRRQAMRLAGYPTPPKGEGDDDQTPEEKAEARKMAKEEAHVSFLAARKGLELRRRFIAKYPNALEDLKAQSPIPCGDLTMKEQMRVHLQTFPREDGLMWLGMPNQSGINPEKGTDYSGRFLTMAQWDSLVAANYSEDGTGEWHPGSFLSQSTYRVPGSRSEENVAQRIWFDLECDGGLSHNDQAALLLGLRDEAGLKLCTVVDTGGKSLHGHFLLTAPLTKEKLVELKPVFFGCPKTKLPRAIQKETESLLWGGIGGDPSMLKDSQPCRLAGCRRLDLDDKGRTIERGTWQTMLFHDPANNPHNTLTINQ